jgi:NAD-dependent SIR2 family protein deacetylase
MPLMPDWSNALCDALDEREHGLAHACRLDRDMDGPAFEKNLGLLLRWQNTRHLAERFELLGADSGWGVRGPVQQARSETARRLEIVIDVLNTTLFDQFGLPRTDRDIGVTAYSQLLKECDGCELMVATTNYDRIAESAIELNSRLVNIGFERWPGETPRLKPAGMVAERGTEVPLIHLHGAVGWYERDGVVRDHYGDQSFNSTLGTPVVLYPDPEKEPTSDAVVQLLWEEFRQAVDAADLILVIGHSLHDPPLVEELSRAIAADTRVIVSYLNEGEQERIDTVLPNAHVVQMDFGPTIASGTPISQLIKKHAGVPVRD